MSSATISTMFGRPGRPDGFEGYDGEGVAVDRDGGVEDEPVQDASARPAAATPEPWRTLRREISDMFPS